MARSLRELMEERKRRRRENSQENNSESDSSASDNNESYTEINYQNLLRIDTAIDF